MTQCGFTWARMLMGKTLSRGCSSPGNGLEPNHERERRSCEAHRRGGTLRPTCSSRPGLASKLYFATLKVRLVTIGDGAGLITTTELKILDPGKKTSSAFVAPKRISIALQTLLVTQLFLPGNRGTL